MNRLAVSFSLSGWPLAAVLLATLGTAAGSARAGDPPAQPTVALEALVAEVLERNPELDHYRAEIAAAKGESRAAGAWANPEVTVTGGRKEVRGNGLAAEGAAWQVTVQQTFEWPGRISLRKAIANREIRLAELGFAQFKAALAARARTLAYNAFASQEKARTADEVAGRFRQLREVLVQRDPAGLTPQLETRILEATELTFQRRATEAALDAQSAALEVNQLRGSAWTEALAVAPVSLTFAAAPDQAKLLAAAQTNNFELRTRREELEQQGLRVSLAGKDAYPSLAVGPYFSQQRAADREQQVGVGLTLPLPLWDRNQGNIEAAEARRQQAATALLVAQRDLDRRVLQASLRYRTKLIEMARWRPDSIDEFRKAADLADRHYRAGAVPVATYVELQKQYLDAVDALLDTQREALGAAQELELLTGLALNAARTAADDKK